MASPVSASAHVGRRDEKVRVENNLRQNDRLTNGRTKKYILRRLFSEINRGTSYEGWPVAAPDYPTLTIQDSRRRPLRASSRRSVGKSQSMLGTSVASAALVVITMRLLLDATTTARMHTSDLLRLRT